MDENILFKLKYVKKKLTLSFDLCKIFFFFLQVCSYLDMIIVFDWDAVFSKPGNGFLTGDIKVIKINVEN